MFHTVTQIVYSTVHCNKWVVCACTARTLLMQAHAIVAHWASCRCVLSHAERPCSPGRSRHGKGHTYPSQFVTPISGRNPKKVRPCRDTNTMSRHKFLQTVSRHQNGVATPLQPTVELSGRDTRSYVATPQQLPSVATPNTV